MLGPASSGKSTFANQLIFAYSGIDLQKHLKDIKFKLFSELLRNFNQMLKVLIDINKEIENLRKEFENIRFMKKTSRSLTELRSEIKKIWYTDECQNLCNKENKSVLFLSKYYIFYRPFIQDLLRKLYSL